MIKGQRDVVSFIVAVACTVGYLFLFPIDAAEARLAWAVGILALVITRVFLEVIGGKNN